MTTLEKFIGQPLNEVRNLGWFGFAADPPTLAHRSIVDATLGSGLVEKLVVFPAGKLPYKDFEASDWERWDMTEIWKAASEFGDEIILSRFDMMRPQAMPWIDLWLKLQEISPSIRHFLVVGSDQYQSISISWIHGRELLQKASFLIVPREGFPTSPVKSQDVLLPIDSLAGSSTNVRKGMRSLVDEKVKAYILEHRLYRS